MSIAAEVGDRCPGKVVGFIADRIVTDSGVAEEESYVVVEVLGIVTASGDGVNIEIENGWADCFDFAGGETGFFGGFFECNLKQVGIAIGMAAQLQPEVEFAMVSEQEAIAGRVYQKRGTGEVAGNTGAVKAVFVPLNEFFEAIDDSTFLGVLLAVDFE